ncbi:unnamed protein product [Peronospora belbahrii]|uniref:FYVE-type domain-containing protein n=1 Tax=Peronospora belbahrii TaxID=622444 RepID=A0AAU9KIQ6_9STRA|nr:unnamed protein product [Peronospora belbahrii]
MKFPLPKNIFPPLELTENQEIEYEHFANALIKSTLAEYDHFVVHDRKRVDSQRWKSIRTRNTVSIYREQNTNNGCQQTPTRLALYQSSISANSSRPSQHAPLSDPVTSDQSDSRNHTISATMTRSFGPSSPQKNKTAFGMDPIKASRDTSRIDSYSSGDLPSEPRITTAAFSNTEADNSGLPRLLAVGTLRGSLDDVMYGIVSPNASSARLRSSYLGEHIADCSVLREIRSPSPAEPFRFLGIKWLVRAKYRGAARIVLPRDFVVLEFSGIMIRPNNSRVGFHLMHSVQIPTCRELHEHRILRAKVSSCYIFEEMRCSRVQVFMTASVDPRGHVLSRMAMRSAATALSNCWKSVKCAHNKKLAYCLQNERPSTIGSCGGTFFRGGNALCNSGIRSSRGGLSALTPVDEACVRDTTEPVSQRSNYSATTNQRRCGVCRGKLGVFSKTTSCQLCSEQICSRCRIVRKLSSTTLKAQVTQSSINFCKKCVASVSDESALEIARQELWVRAHGRTRASSAISATHFRSSFPSERSTYATVVLGRGSEMNSRGSAATSSLSLSQGLGSFSQSRGPPYEESMLGQSVGPRSSTFTQSSTPLQRPSSGARFSKKFLLNASGMSVGSLASTTLSTDVLSFADLGMENNNKNKVTVAADKEEATKEEPVVLDHRVTMTLRNLRHLDYVLSVGEEDLVQESENEDTVEYGEFESSDEGEGRSSYESSVAVLDDDYEMCETPTSDAPQSQHESPIVEGEEDEENEEKTKQQGDKKYLETEEPKKHVGCLAELSHDDEEEQQPEEDNWTPELTQEETKVIRKLPEEYDEPVLMAMSVHDGDADEHDMTMAVEVEVVEAAPIAEVRTMMMSQDKLRKGKSETEAEISSAESESRLHRAHTTVSSSEETTYQHQLFQQMQDLHNVVESTYQVARANTEAAFKERDSGRISKTSPTNASGNLRGVRTFSQPFTFNVVGLRSTRAMTVGSRK